MKKYIKLILQFFSESFSSLTSLARLLIFASPLTAIRFSKYKDNNNRRTCIVLGNGPSLNEALRNKEVEKGDYFALNMFVLSEYFVVLKPSFYFLVDGAFFNPYDSREKELSEKIVDSLSKVYWKMVLIVPNRIDYHSFAKRLNNPNITVLRTNTNDFLGYKTIRNFIYKINMGAPPCQTVMITALFSAINLGYKKIFLYGADHSWTKDLTVNDNNIVCYGDRHVYSTGLSVIEKKINIATMLDRFSRMFKSHYVIREYADSQNVSIINKTKGSFVDAYERK